MVSRCLEKRLEESEIRGQIETIQITLLLRSARSLKKVLEKVMALYIHSAMGQIVPLLFFYNDGFGIE